MAPTTISSAKIVQRHILWIFVGFVIMTQLLPLLLAEGYCKKPICYVSEELKPRNRHIFKIDCIDSDKYDPAKIIFKGCVSDISIGDLIHGINSQAAKKHEAAPTVQRLLDSSLEPVSATLGQTENISSTTGPITPSHGTEVSSKHLNGVHATSVPFTDNIGVSTSTGRAIYESTLTEGPTASSTNSDLIDRINSQAVKKNETTPTVQLLLDSSFEPVSATLGQTENKSSTNGPLTLSHGTEALSKHLNGVHPTALPFMETIGVSTPTSSTTFKSTLTEGPTASSTISASEEITEKFIFTFLHVSCTKPVADIFIGTKSFDVGASGYISLPLKDIPNKTFSLSPGSGEIFVVPSTAVPSENELNQMVNTAMVIASDEEVVVYGHQRCYGLGEYRATAFDVRGIEDLGTEYWVVTHQTEGKSQVGVVATNNDTNISINGVYINKTLTLNKYETFYFGGPYDLTGTYIVADKPILVIAGNSADISPYSSIYGVRDSFYKCLPPVKDWGRHFTLVPFPPQSQPFTAKILSSHDNCTLECVNGTGNRISVSLTKGEVGHLTSSNVLHINSSEGILVAQFSKGERGHGGNPSMLLTPHYGDAGRNEFIFPVFNLSKNNDDERRSFITIWLRSASDIFLDSETVSWDAIGKDINGYDIVRITLSSPGVHIIHSSKNITAIFSGVGWYKYYSYSLR